jgi:PTH1 family peptidyl-tRNA hydrolase
MKLLVGLGNPGREYANTRHNIGFLCLDELARRHGAAFDKVHLRALIATVSLGAERVVLARPQTFMNLSGEAVGALLSWYKLPASDLIVVTDDMDLPFGRLRLRLKGSAGGHNGLKSIIESLGTLEFPRLRVGIGRPPGRQPPAASCWTTSRRRKSRRCPSCVPRWQMPSKWPLARASRRQ